MQREQPRRVRADAEVAGVAERRQAAVAEQQVEARGEEAEDQDLRQQEGAVVVEQRRRGDEEREHDEPGPRARPRHSAEQPLRPHDQDQRHRAEERERRRLREAVLLPERDAERLRLRR